MPDAPDAPDRHDPGSPDGDTAGTATAVIHAPHLDAQAAAPPGPTAEQLALEAGWTMAVLYGTIEPIPPGEISGLPTANELQPADRRRLELDRLRHLLQHLARMPGFAGSGLPTEVPAPDEDDKARKDALI